MGANNADFNFSELDKNIVSSPAFLSDEEGQKYNKLKQQQRAEVYGSQNTRASEKLWWHTQPQPPATTVEDGVTVRNRQGYNIHASEAHIKHLTTGQPVSPEEEPLGPTFTHHSPPHAYTDITANGLRPAVTATSGHDSRRFGVFLGRKSGQVDTSSPGMHHDVWEVSVPKEDLRSGPDGDLYVERRIKPSEIKHVGHVCSRGSVSAGRAVDCPSGHQISY